MARVRGRSWAIALSGLFHLVVLAWLLEQRQAELPAGSPPMQVSLVSLSPHPARSPKPSARASRAAIQATPPEAGPEAAPQVAAIPAAPKVDDAPGEAFQRTLSGLAGCAPSLLAQMSVEARRRCQDRLAARTAKDRDWASVGLDRTGEFAASQNPEAYINRKPHNGCKIRAAGDTDIRGKDGARAAFACAWSF